ncbi:membrane or secreted protein [Aequorivita viscosa]|nr:membrane or secreted protein [Aequorivita viscosa]
MKKIVFCLICSFISFGINAQSFRGAWESFHTSEDGENLRNVLIFSERYQVITTYNTDSGEFIATNGGSWKLEGDTMTEKVEFNSVNPEKVGSETSFKVAINDTIIEIVGSNVKMKRIDDGTPGHLQGAWLMSGRTIDGKTQLRDTDTPRKTMKILSGSRFQWIAYNTETKQFMATGGGTYTTKDEIYTENIEFFSRDISKVGLQLKFDYNLKDGNWHHSGFSTKGGPIDEVWSKRK